jgi:hypothetical protein
MDAHDWLDTGCWRCGSDEATSDGEGRVLCGSCREDLFGVPPMVPGEFTSERVYWQSHMLECCWRCMGNQVDADDELGLCADCRDAFVEEAKAARGRNGSRDGRGRWQANARR